jgi:hypothetical protein
MDNANADIMLISWLQCGASLAACGNDAGCEIVDPHEIATEKKSGCHLMANAHTALMLIL